MARSVKRGSFAALRVLFGPTEGLNAVRDRLESERTVAEVLAMRAAIERRESLQEET